MNQIVYNIYNHDDFEELQLQILEDLKVIVPNTCASIFLTDEKERRLFREPVCYPEKYAGLERGQETSFFHWFAWKTQPTIMKRSEMMEDEEFMYSQEYKEEFEPYGVFYAIYVILAGENKSLGMLVMYRDSESGDFDEEDCFWLEQLGPHLRQRLLKERKRKRAETTPKGEVLKKRFGFTARETEIVEYIIRGASNSDIIEEVNISPNTLKSHLQNIYRKTGVKSRHQLIMDLRNYR
jgi:DNA-binding CsgD family transcriptional regulator